MPIGSGGGIRGSPGILAMPGRRYAASAPNTNNPPTYSSCPIRRPPLSDYNSATITGVTKNSAGTALGNCVVQLFRTKDDAILFETTSDGSGNYRFTIGEAGPFYVVAYLAGAPDVAGTTVNTLTAT